MNRGKILSRLLVISILISMIFTTAGCGPKKPGTPTGVSTPPTADAKEAVLLLKFSKGRSDTYKSIMETERSVNFAGDITQDKQFKSAKSGTRAEMVFQQQTENVDPTGNATIKVTITSLKYLSKSKDVITLDYDSSNQQQQSNPLTRLIGQSYTITMSPRGEVTGIGGLDQIKRSAAADAAAVQLISENLIRERHQIPALVDANSKTLKVGDKWSVTRTLTFGILGSTSVEKIYTLKAIVQNKGRRTAMVEIMGVPATIQEGLPSPKKFESGNTYTGSLELDLDSGKIEQYSEKTTSEWLIADEKVTEGELSVIKLSTTQLNSLERLD